MSPRTSNARSTPAHEVAVVVSAMAGKTNELVAWCKEAGAASDTAEYDAVVASGELVTAGLLAIVLKDIGPHRRAPGRAGRFRF